MQLNIQIGDRMIRPTANEQQLAAGGAVALVLGLVTGSSWLKLGGAVALGSVAYSVWEESSLFVQPEAMNAYFQTGGATSALGPSPQGAAAYALPASSPAAAAAAPGLGDVIDIRTRRRRR